jgi:hypothetical protein
MQVLDQNKPLNKLLRRRAKMPASDLGVHEYGKHVTDAELGLEVFDAPTS